MEMSMTNSKYQQ